MKSAENLNFSNTTNEESSGKITLKHINKIYQVDNKNFMAIKDVNITVQDNDFICIIGPSGCGKSTLLHMLAGLDHPTEGELLFNGQPIVCPGAERGMVFQTYTLFPWLTVKKNIEFGLKQKKLPSEQINKIVNKYLCDVQLESFRDNYPRQLSGGMKQRVAIARALANQPEVLLMD